MQKSWSIWRGGCYDYSFLGGVYLDITVVFQIAAVGILVAVLNQVLIRAGREELAMMTTLAGLVVVLFWIIQYISTLFETVQTLFQLR